MLLFSEEVSDKVADRYLPTVSGVSELHALVFFHQEEVEPLPELIGWAEESNEQEACCSDVGVVPGLYLIITFYGHVWFD